MVTTLNAAMERAPLENTDITPRNYYCLPVVGGGATIYDNRNGAEVAVVPDLQTGDEIILALTILDKFRAEGYSNAKFILEAVDIALEADDEE